MLTQIAFILTATILISASIKMAGAIIGNGVTMPPIIPFTDVGPTRGGLMYTSIAYQVWFWTEQLAFI